MCENTYYMVKQGVLAALIDNKKAAVLKTLLFSKEELYLKEISSRSNVSLTSTFRIVNELVTLEIFTKKKWKSSKVYHCNENEKVEFLKELFAEKIDGVQEFATALGSVSEIEQIILHGGRKKDSANMLLIGSDIPSEAVEAAQQIVASRGFDISYLTLTKGQYEQMSKMGLYSGKKEVIK